NPQGGFQPEKIVSLTAAGQAGELRSRAIRTLIGCTFLWGLSFSVMKSLSLAQQKLLPGPGSWFFTSLDVAYRFGLAAVVLAILAWREIRTLRRREVEQGIVISGVAAAGILFQMDGLSYTDASVSAFLTQGYCVFIPVWLALRHRRLPGRKIMLCILLVILGVGVLARLNWHEFKLGRGEWETLLGSLMFTGQILCLEHPRYATNRPAPFSVVMFAAMALFCLPVILATAPGWSATWQAYASIPTLVFLLILVVPCTLMAYLMMNQWQRHVSATEAGLIYCIEPVCASALALFLPAWFSRWVGIDYPDEQFTLRLLIGGGLITAANLLLQSRWLEPAASQAAPRSN
ncbi:MAG TPA: DMT family transporter, partial [Verrucomicrobiae bacterium]